MKRAVRCLLLGMAVTLGTVQLRAADSNIVKALREQYDVTSALVMGMAEAIPEEKYGYKPTPEVRSFREQLQHLVQENNNYVSIMNGEDTGDQQRFFKIMGRAELLKALRDSYDRAKKAIADLTDEKAVEVVSVSPTAPSGIRGMQKPKWAIMMAVMLDNMDHYGNLVVYARLNGIVPPRTAARQQQTK